MMYSIQYCGRQCSFLSRVHVENLYVHIVVWVALCFTDSLKIFSIFLLPKNGYIWIERCSGSALLSLFERSRNLND